MTSLKISQPPNSMPKEWVHFFADSGARYFVPTTKHHDGFSLFDISSKDSN